MRFSSVAAVVAAAAPLAVTAKGQLGYALGARLSDGSCKGLDDYAADFEVLKETATIVRTYANIDGGDPSAPQCTILPDLLEAASIAKVQVILGIWADTNTAFQADSDQFFAHAKDFESTIYAVTIGSEALYRNQQDASTGLTADGLLNQIQKFNKTIYDNDLQGKFKVGTADSWNKFQDGTATDIITSPIVDILLVNAFAYWQQQTISNATATYLDDLQQAFGKIQATAGSTTKIELWNGEVGWPTTGGTNYGAAEAGTANAETFYKQGVCAALDWNINVFYFEAFDEPWKPVSTGADGEPGNENHWGAYNVDRSPKFSDYSCKYSS